MVLPVYTSTDYVLLGRDAGLLIQRIVLPPGTSGGHGLMAGGQIPLDGQRIEPLIARIKRRYLVEMEETGAGGPLLQPKGGLPCPE